MNPNRLTLLGVPIDSVGGTGGGTELAPAVLRGLLARETLDDAGDTVRRIRGRRRDRNGWLEFGDNLEVTSELRIRVGELTAAGRIPLVLGGCCALVPGALAGARDSLGSIGLAYVDGHLDLLTGGTSPTGEGADMPVAAALGFAPPELLDRIGRTPLTEPNRVALAGARDRDELDLIQPWPDGLGIGRVDTREDLRRANLSAAGRRITVTADGDADLPFWLHLDVDVLDRAEFPATDYLMDDGLDLSGLTRLLEPVTASAGLAGVSIACFNPEKDRDGRCGRALAGLIGETLMP